MTKEKMASLKKHIENHKNKLADLAKSVPDKHKTHPHTYKAFLEREIKLHSDKIEAAVMAATPNAT